MHDLYVVQLGRARQECIDKGLRRGAAFVNVDAIS
jgi:hypothetical protein